MNRHEPAANDQIEVTLRQAANADCALLDVFVGKDAGKIRGVRAPKNKVSEDRLNDWLEKGYAKVADVPWGSPQIGDRRMTAVCK